MYSIFLSPYLNDKMNESYSITQNFCTSNQHLTVIFFPFFPSGIWVWFLTSLNADKALFGILAIALLGHQCWVTLINWLTDAAGLPMHASGFCCLFGVYIKMVLLLSLQTIAKWKKCLEAHTYMQNKQLLHYYLQSSVSAIKCDDSIFISIF